MKNFLRGGSILILIFAGCATAYEQTPPRIDSEGRKVGSVAYNPDGLAEIVSMRRKDAIRVITESCAPKSYAITKEEAREPKSGENTNSLAGFGASKLNYLDYRCEK
jgi:hypothetical protein